MDKIKEARIYTVENKRPIVYMNKEAEIVSDAMNQAIMSKKAWVKFETGSTHKHITHIRLANVSSYQEVKEAPEKEEIVDF